MSKRNEYNQRIREIEYGSFAPLVFAASGGMGPSTTIANKRLASLLASRRHVLNNHAVAMLPTVLQPPKISHQRNKSVCPHPNPVNPPGYGRGQNRINKLTQYTILFIRECGSTLYVGMAQGVSFSLYIGIGAKFQNTQKTGERRLRTAEYRTVLLETDLKGKRTHPAEK